MNLGANNDVQEVLCLTPWQVSFVNGGHECVVAEAYSQQVDPLPSGPDFNVPTDRHVAQRNLTVLTTAPGMMFHFQFEVQNASRLPQTFSIATRMGDPASIKPLLPKLGTIRLPKGGGEIEKLGFITPICPSPKDMEDPKGQIDRLELGGNSRASLTLVGKLKGDAALVHVVQHVGKRETGGLSVLVISGEGKGEK